MAKFTIKAETLDAIRTRDPNDVFVDKFRFCAVCGNSTIDKVLQCSSCRVVYYCNRECQRKDWSRHKGDCQQHKQQKPTVEALTKYCASLNRSRIETFYVGQTMGAFLIINDVQEFLKLDDKHVFSMIDPRPDKVLPYTYAAYSDFDEFVAVYKMIYNSNQQMYSGTISGFKDIVKLGWFMLVIYAPALGFCYCKEIN